MLERMRANAIEAAEQCGVLALPEIAPPVALARVISPSASRRGIWCSVTRLPKLPIRWRRSARLSRDCRLRSWSGPKADLPRMSARCCSRQPNVVRLALGPRILRADTAAVAVLALVQAVLGDWR